MSAPANPLATTPGRCACWSASPMPGRAFPAAHPHTELTTIITTPGDFTTASTSSGVRHSRGPMATSSWRMGATRYSGYGIYDPPTETRNEPDKIDYMRRMARREFFAVGAGSAVAGLVIARPRALQLPANFFDQTRVCDINTKPTTLVPAAAGT